MQTRHIIQGICIIMTLHGSHAHSLSNVFSYLFSNENTTLEEKLHNAIESCDYNSVIQYVQQGADVNSKNERNESALHKAVIYNRYNIAQELIENDADIHITNSTANTPLHLAAHFGYKDLTNLLISKKANVQCKDRDNETPLLKSTRGDHYDVSEMLINSGADVNTPSSSGITPIHNTAHNGNEDHMRLLISKGSYINPKDSITGKTPLHISAQNGHLHTTMVLMLNGADTQAKAKKRITPRKSQHQGPEKVIHGTCSDLSSSALETAPSSAQVDMQYPQDKNQSKNRQLPFAHNNNTELTPYDMAIRQAKGAIEKYVNKNKQ